MVETMMNILKTVTRYLMWARYTKDKYHERRMYTITLLCITHLADPGNRPNYTAGYYTPNKLELYYYFACYTNIIII